MFIDRISGFRHARTKVYPKALLAGKSPVNNHVAFCELITITERSSV